MESMNNRGEMKQTESMSQELPKGKRAYQTPHLREWGTVAGLTLAGAGAVPEFYAGSQLT
jgi:hypothetical protein